MMARAVECDACHALVPWNEAIDLEVGVPKKPDEGSGWSDINICGSCLQRPMGEVLAEACDGFRDDLRKALAMTEAREAGG